MIQLPRLRFQAFQNVFFEEDKNIIGCPLFFVQIDFHTVQPVDEMHNIII